MAKRRNILPALMGQKSALIDQALSEALRTAEPDEAGPLAEAVLSRDRPDRSVGLILRYHELPAKLRHRIIERAEELATAVRKAGTRHGKQGAQNALAIIEQAGSVRMAYLVTAMIRHADPAIRDRAAACLRGLVARCVAEPGQVPALDAVSTRYLAEAVEQAVVQYANHAHPAVLEALLGMLPHPMPEAFAALSNSEHPAVEPVGLMASDAASPGVCTALLLLLSVGPIRLAAADGLARAGQTALLEHTLHRGHLLALPAVRRGLSRTHEPQRLWPNAGRRGALPEPSQRHLPAYAAALMAEPHDLILRLAGLARSKHAATRLATLRRLLALYGRVAASDPRAADNTNDAIATFTRDTEVPLARTALWHLIRIQYSGLPRILADLVNSRHPEIRGVASRHLAPLGFERYWQAWPKLDAPKRLAAGRALIKIDADFHRHLGTHLGSRDTAAQLRALGMVSTLGQGGYFEQALIDLAGSDDARVVASAVRALGDCPTDSARRVVRLALEHDDGRIRANAVEAMAKADAARHLDKLITIAQDDQVQRPRANAIKALMELRAKDALPALTTMLSDTRAGHRVSALWLIDELGLLQLARQVAEMSITDADDDVKARAGRVVQHLIDDLERQVSEQDQEMDAA